MVNAASTIRRQVEAETRPAHLALHEHPEISRLLGEDLTQARYTRLIAGYGAFYQAAEERRAGARLWQEFSLAREVAALCADNTGPPAPKPKLDIPEDAPSLLGMLYVLHGAGFGGQVIAKAVARSLPGARRSFFSLGAVPAKWRSLVTAMDSYRDDSVARDRLSAAAGITFAAFGDHATLVAG